MKKNNKGFTLLELLLVIAAIGILIAIVVVAINPNRQFALVRDSTRQQNINSIYKALDQYVIDKGTYPEELTSGNYDSLCSAQNTTGCVNLNSKLIPDYLPNIPADPKGENYLIGIHPINQQISVWAVDAELRLVIINPIDGAIVDKANTTPFIIKVKTDNTGSSGANQFTLPTIGVGYNYDVNWGDGSTSSNIRGKITKTYNSPGTYQVSITGTFPRIYFNNTGDKAKITEISQWGTIAWKNMDSAFSGTNISITATDTPNLNNVSSMAGMFRGATVSGSNLTSWNTINAVNMNEMFQSATITGSDISNWSVDNVLNMTGMFQNATTFNQDLSSWCVSNIPTQPSNFDIGATAWSLSRPIWGTCPFTITIKTNNAGSSASNQFTIPTTGTGYNYTVRWGDGSVSTGVTGNITKTYSVAGTYRVAITGSFPRIYFNNTGDKLKLIEINKWGSNVWGSSMAGAFSGTSFAIKATDKPNFSGVTDMVSMFASANLSGQDLSNWNVGNVTNTNSMFYSANLSGANLSGWNLAKVTLMGPTVIGWTTEGMFNRATLTNANLSNWTLGSATTKVTNVINIFYLAVGVPDISSWNVGNVTNMTGMFNGATLTGQNLSNWNISNSTNMTSMFASANLSGVQFSNWVLPNSTYSSMFASATNIPSLSNWNVSSVTNMSSMFASANLSGQDLSNWNVSNVTTTDIMFAGANLTGSNLANWNLSKVTTTGGTTSSNGMFNGATLTNANLSNWILGSATTKVTNTGYMFRLAINTPDISSWNVGNVTNMVNMFNSASTFNQNLSGWCVSSIPTKPTGFDTGATAWTLSRPIWGTCP